MQKNYETRAILDFGLLLDDRQVRMKTIHDMTNNLDNRLESVDKGLAAIARTLDGFTAEHSGVWVYSTDPDTERGNQQQRRAERQQNIRDQEAWLHGRTAAAQPAESENSAADPDVP